MATEVYTTVEIRLLNEEEVELRPLPIAKLRKFTRIWSDHMNDVTKKIAENQNKSEDDESVFGEADLTDAQYDAFIKMCALGLESQLKGDRTDRQFLSFLEEVLDEQTIYKILDVTGGLKFGKKDDPNLTAPTVGDGAN